MTLNIPTALTLSRLLMLPIIMVAYYLPYSWAPLVAAAIFLLAAITDILDGYLARALNQSTRFGEFLDPVVDKVTVVAALVLCVEYYNVWWMTLPTVCLIGREVVVSALREWMAGMGKRDDVAVSTAGKVKTTLQMLAIASLLWHFNAYVVYVGLVLLYSSLVMSFYSLLKYFKAAWKSIIQP